MYVPVIKTQVCREATGIILINQCLQSRAASLSHGNEITENKFVTESLLGRDSPSAGATV